MCFYSRRKLKTLEQNLNIIVSEYKREYDTVCMLSGRIVKAIEFIESFEYYIPEDNKEELLKILEGKEHE